MLYESNCFTHLQKWRYFPSTWEERGYFLAIDYDPYEVCPHPMLCSLEYSCLVLATLLAFLKQNPSNCEHGLCGKQFGESRSGEFIHPTKGKLVTYLRQVYTYYISMYFYLYLKLLRI